MVCGIYHDMYYTRILDNERDSNKGVVRKVFPHMLRKGWENLKVVPTVRIAKRPVPEQGSFYYHNNIFGGSSAVEQLAVNQLAAGSIPALRASQTNAPL